MGDPPTSPKDVADALDAMAKRLRARAGIEPAEALVAVDAALLPSVWQTPELGEPDVSESATHVAVTMLTRHADLHEIEVTVLGLRLHVALGEGLVASRREVSLPPDIDAEAASATLRNGVLDIVLPRR